MTSIKDHKTSLPSATEIESAITEVVSHARDQGLNPTDDQIYNLRMQIMAIGQNFPIIVQTLAAKANTKAMSSMPDVVKNKMFAEIRAIISISVIAAGLVFILLQDMPKIAWPVALFIGVAPGTAAIIRYLIARKKDRSKHEVML